MRNILGVAIAPDATATLIDTIATELKQRSANMRALDLSTARWRRSSRSESNTRVEVAFAGPAAASRDSENTDGSGLTFPTTALTGLLVAIRK